MQHVNILYIKTQVAYGTACPMNLLQLLFMISLLIKSIIVFRQFIVCLTFKFNVFKKIRTYLRVFLLNLKGMVISSQFGNIYIGFLFLFRIRFKILFLTLQTYHGVAPDYLCELVIKHHAVRALRCNDMMLLDEPKIRVKTYGPRAFIYTSHMNGISYLCLLEKVLIFQ